MDSLPPLCSDSSAHAGSWPVRFALALTHRLGVAYFTTLVASGIQIAAIIWSMIRPAAPETGPSVCSSSTLTGTLGVLRRAAAFSSAVSKVNRGWFHKEVLLDVV